MECEFCESEKYNEKYRMLLAASKEHEYRDKYRILLHAVDEFIKCSKPNTQINKLYKIYNNLVGDRYREGK